MTKPSHWEMTSGHSEMTIYKKSDADDSKSVTTDFGQTRMTIFKKSFATDRHFSLCGRGGAAAQRGQVDRGRAGWPGDLVGW